MATDKKKGLTLDMRTFQGESEKTYIVFREKKSSSYSYHVFQEIEAKEAANDCGEKNGHTNKRWKNLWDKID